MLNLLVTGGAGFIGSNFVHYMLRTEPDVKILTLDSLTYAASLDNLKNLPDPQRHTFIKGNVCDECLIDNILQTYSIDTIVHFAAETHVDRSIFNPKLFIETNIGGTLTLLNAAYKYWSNHRQTIKKNFRFHHISTDEVFGSLPPLSHTAFSETTSYAPNSPYAASKAGSDHLVRAYAHTYGLPITITNCSNNYGPRQFPEKLIPLSILNALVMKDLPIYGDGKQIRDWLYVDDHCEAIRLVLLQGRQGETYNIGGNNQITNLSVVEMICDLLEELKPSQGIPYRSLIKFVEDRPGHDKHYAMNITKISHELGWSPQNDLKQGLRKTILWYFENSEWVRNIQERPDYQKWISQNYIDREMNK